MREKVQNLSALGVSRSLPSLKDKKHGKSVTQASNPSSAAFSAWERLHPIQGATGLRRVTAALPLYLPLVKCTWAAFWLVSLFLSFSCAQNSRLKPGLWEFEMSFDMPDMPETRMQPFKWQECVKEEEAKQGTIFSGQQPSLKERPDCKMENIRYPQPGHVTYEVICAHPTEGKMRMIVDYRYTETSFEGTSRTEMNGQEFTYKMKGKYLGSCKK
jgi:hypothetical protein